MVYKKNKKWLLIDSIVDEVLFYFEMFCWWDFLVFLMEVTIKEVWCEGIIG